MRMFEGIPCSCDANTSTSYQIAKRCSPTARQSDSVPNCLWTDCYVSVSAAFQGAGFQGAARCSHSCSAFVDPPASSTTTDNCAPLMQAFVLCLYSASLSRCWGAWLAPTSSHWHAAQWPFTDCASADLERAAQTVPTHCSGSSALAVTPATAAWRSFYCSDSTLSSATLFPWH